MAADDNNSVLLFVSAVLSTLDQEPEIVTATNGEEALRIAIERTPHVIIMDWEMPVMDGLTAVRQLKATPETAEIPIVMLTGVAGDGDEEMVRMALDAGAMDYVTKPVGPTELIARVETALRIEAVPTPPAVHALLDRLDAQSGIGRRIRRVDDSSEVEVVRNRQRDAADAHHAVREGMSPAPGMEIFMIPTRAHDSGRAPF
ncbi:MAG: response regulator [Gemmatimonadota bacterium]|nr:response regulator [Gemmatimonadota bacterium]